MLKDVQSRGRESNYKREFWLGDQITKLVKIVCGVSRLLVRGPQVLRGKSLYLLVRWLRLPEAFCQKINELHLCFSYVLNGYVDSHPGLGVP